MSEPLPEAPWRVSAKKARRHLSRDLIVTTALEVLAREGFEAVSMRRVAQALDTGAASLYAHVQNKNDLYELMYEQVLSTIEIPEYDPTRWREQLKQVARAITKVMIDNPGIARISMHVLIPTSPAVLVKMDHILGLLRAGGLPDKIAIYASDMVALYCTAIAYEASLWSGAEGTAEEAQRRIDQIDEYLDLLPPHQLAHLRALRPLMMDSDDGTERFEFALSLLIDGLERFIENP